MMGVTMAEFLHHAVAHPLFGIAKALGMHRFAEWIHGSVFPHPGD